MGTQENLIAKISDDHSKNPIGFKEVIDNNNIYRHHDLVIEYMVKRMKIATRKAIYDYIDGKTEEMGIQKSTLDWEPFITSRDIHHIAGKYNMYAEYLTSKEEWIMHDIGSFRTRFPELDDSKDYRTFRFKMKELGRMRTGIISSWKQDNTDDLNVLRDTNKIQPIESKNYHHLFDDVFNALSNNRKAERDHIERVLVWKWLNPAEHMLPALIFSGCGGAGKSLLGTLIAPFLYSRKKLAALPKSCINTKFNGPMAGRTVVFFDELLQEKSDHEKLKTWVQSISISLENKGVDSFSSDLIYLMIVAGNTDENPNKCAIRLAGDGAKGQIDRRWSVFNCSITVDSIVMKNKNLTLEKAKEYIQNNSNQVFLNETEMGKWLYCMLEKHSDLKSAPTAFHATDYEFFTVGQDKVLHEVFEELFVKNSPQFVTTDNLYLMYKGHYLECNPSIKYSKGKSAIIPLINSYIQKQNLPYTLTPGVNVTIAGKRTQRIGWKSNTASGTLTDYSETYFDTTAYNGLVYRNGSISS